MLGSVVQVHPLLPYLKPLIVFCYQGFLLQFDASILLLLSASLTCGKYGPSLTRIQEKPWPNKLNSLAIFALVPGLTAPTPSTADVFNLKRFDIDGAWVGDRKNHFLSDMSAHYPATTRLAKRALSSSLLYTMPIRCHAVEEGSSRWKGKFAEMQIMG